MPGPKASSRTDARRFHEVASAREQMMADAALCKVQGQIDVQHLTEFWVEFVTVLPWVQVAKAAERSVAFVASEPRLLASSTGPSRPKSNTGGASAALP